MPEPEKKGEAYNKIKKNFLNRRFESQYVLRQKSL